MTVEPLKLSDDHVRFFVNSTDENAPRKCIDAKETEDAVRFYAHWYYHKIHTFITTAIRVEPEGKPAKFYRVDAVQGEFIITDITGVK